MTDIRIKMIVPTVPNIPPSLSSLLDGMGVVVMLVGIVGVIVVVVIVGVIVVVVTLSSEFLGVVPAFSSFLIGIVPVSTIKTRNPDKRMNGIISCKRNEIKKYFEMIHILQLLKKIPVCILFLIENFKKTLNVFSFSETLKPLIYLDFFS
jgi:hypothetical protein